MIYLLDSILDGVTISAAKFNAIAKNISAGIAQLVERNLAKVEVASSSLVSRSMILQTPASPGFTIFDGLGGRVVMQRPAKPCTPVRFRP